MNKLVSLNDPSELKVVNGWLAETRIRATRNVLLGSAAIVAAAGLGLAAMIWAWGQHGPSPEERAADLKAALADMPPLKVDLPPVKLADGTQVTIAEGGKVTLNEPAEVTLAPGGTVKLDTSSLAKLKLDLPKLPAAPKTQGGDPIARSVTVFNTVDLGGGEEVVSGWIYPTGNAKTPVSQYCYWSAPLPTGKLERVNVALNRTPEPMARQLLGSRFDAIMSKCVWG